MRIFHQNQPADAKTMRRQGESAFTMVEIAIAIGVIGFALVAIIGILPAGMNVQKDVREDTIISQDAPYFLEAIRNGVPVNPDGSIGYGGASNNYAVASGLNYLANYVQSIKYVTVVNYTNYATNEFYPNPTVPTLTGAIILGLLSRPQQYIYNSTNFAGNYTNTVAVVRALSGPASLQQTGANTGMSSLMAFTYQMEVMITPFNSFAPDTTNWSTYSQVPGMDSNQWIIRSNRWREATNNGPSFYSPYFNATMYTGGLQNNLFEVQLRFSWPVFPNGSVGPHHQTYRTMIASRMASATIYNMNPPLYNLWYFQPQTYTNNTPFGL